MPSRGQFFLEDVVDMVGYAVEETSPYAKRMPKGGGGHSKYKDAWIDDYEVERESQSVGCRPPKDSVQTKGVSTLFRPITTFSQNNADDTGI